MRKIINQPEAIVTEMGRGIALTYPGLVFDPKFHYIMTALTPISEAANGWVQKRFPGRDLAIGLDWPILAGNAEIWVAIILTIPVALGVSLVLPGNTVLPFGNLMDLSSQKRAAIASRSALHLRLRYFSRNRLAHTKKSLSRWALAAKL